jgi:hypothetical protein
MNRRTVLVGLLAFSILFAGCTQLQNTNDDEDGQDQGIEVTQNDGLTIDFSSVTNEYYDGDSYTFTADFQNTGEHEAKITNWTIYGPSWLSDDYVSSPRTLGAVEEANQFAGGTTSNQFTGSVSTSLGAGQTDDWDVGLRTYYNYSASSRATLTVINQDEYRDDSAARTAVQTNVNAGPVHIRFDVRTPIPAGRAVNIPIQIRNVGDGELDSFGGTDKAISYTISREGSGSICSSDGFETLYEGSRTFNCQFDTSNLLGGAPQTSVTLVAEANFKYMEDDTARVSVIGE